MNKIELTPDEQKLLDRLRSDRDKALVGTVGSTNAAVYSSYTDAELHIWELIRADRELKTLLAADHQKQIDELKLTLIDMSGWASITPENGHAIYTRPILLTGNTWLIFYRDDPIPDILSTGWYWQVRNRDGDKVSRTIGPFDTPEKAISDAVNSHRFP